MSYYLGEIILFGGIKIPPGFLPCDGREIRVKDNPALYTIIMNNFGGTPEKTFRLPDLRGRSPIGYSPYAPQGRISHQLGEAGGEEGGIEGLRIKEENLPPHEHQVTGEVKVQVQVANQVVDVAEAAGSYLGKLQDPTNGGPGPSFVQATPSTPIEGALSGVKVETKLTAAKAGRGEPITFKVPRDPYLTVRYLICVGNKGVDCEYPVTDEEAHDM